MKTTAQLSGKLLILASVMLLTGCAGNSSTSEHTNYPLTNRPHVSGIAYPQPNQKDVRRDTNISANLYLPTNGKGVDSSTLDKNVRLFRKEGGQAVPGIANTDGAGANITFSPGQLLDANTEYVFEVKGDLKDETGAAFVPFKSGFSTGAGPDLLPPPVTFASRQVYPPTSYSKADAPIASLTVGPDQRLYGVTLDGKVLRWNILADGTLSNPPTNIAPDELAGRAIIGLAFDPANAGVLWISHNAPLFTPDRQPAPDFSGEISKLILPKGTETRATLQRYVIGLPRSTKDHLTNSLAFNRSGDRLYVSQGSNSATGAVDGYWLRPERLLSGAVLQIDPRRDVSAGPINVQTAPCDPSAHCLTSGAYRPESGQPVTIYADGVRNAYDLVWHSNGYLYFPTNGSAAGGNTPRSPDGSAPALSNAPIQKDFLFKTNTPGGYFGHPNPLRQHYVLNGGNPSAAEDPGEVIDDLPSPDAKKGYPVGVRPDPKYRGYAFDFGKNRSPNGVIEYKSSAFGGKLKGKLLVVEYTGSSTVLVLTLRSDGNVAKAEKIGYADARAGLKRPLDLAEDPRNGNLYIAELEEQPTEVFAPKSRITLLKPVP